MSHPHVVGQACTRPMCATVLGPLRQRLRVALNLGLTVVVKEYCLQISQPRALSLSS